MEQSLRHFPKTFIIPDSFDRSFCGVDRNAVLSAENSKPLNMVGVLMGNKNPVQLVPFHIQILQSFLDPLLADPGIDQHVCMFISYINTVSAASAGYTANSHVFLSPSKFLVRF